MFSQVPNGKQSYTIANVDRDEVARGILATFNDGSQRRITYQDLNIPLNLATIGDSFIGIYRFLTVVCDIDHDDQGINPITGQRNRKKRARRVVRKLMQSFRRTLNKNVYDQKYIIDLTVWRRLYRYDHLDSNPQMTVELPLTPVSCKRLAGYDEIP